MTAHSPTLTPLYYVTAHSTDLPLLHLRHRHFTAHALWWLCNQQWLRPAGLYERCKLALEPKRLKTSALRRNSLKLNSWRYSSEGPRSTRAVAAIYQVTTELSARDWVDPVADLMLPDTFQGYSRKSKPVLLGWHLDVLITISERLRWDSFQINSVHIYMRFKFKVLFIHLNNSSWQLIDCRW